MYRSTHLILAIVIAIAFGIVLAADDERDRSIEHIFQQGPATIIVDAKKKKGYTRYKFCLDRDEDSIRNMNPNNQRLNIALQWLNQDFKYESLIFKLKVPVLSRHYPFIMDIKKGQSWYDHQDMSPEEYVKEILVHNYDSTEEPNIDRNSAYALLERNLNRLKLNEKEKICIDFVQNQLEPEGYNKLWMAWEYYDDSSTCMNYKYCLTFQRAEGSSEPIVYFNGKEYFDEYDSDFIMTCYWIMTGLSFFPFVASPLVALIGLTMQAYVGLVATI